MASSSTSSSRRTFFVKLIAFLVLLVALDAGLGALLRHFYFTQKSGLNRRTTYAVQESRDSIIILGSSRAQAHYVPSILEEGLGGTCYNAGRNGQSVLYAGAVYNSIVGRQAPDVVILDLIMSDFFVNHAAYDRLSALLPYFKDNHEVRPYVLMRSPMERVKLMSGIYPFNSLPLQILKYNLKESGPDKGFVAQRGTIPLPVRPPKDRPWVRNGLDENMIRAFTGIVTACQENDIELYVLISPLYDGKVFGAGAMEDVDRILAGSGFELWDYSDHEDFLKDNELFRDRDHLNVQGAEAYTAMLVNRILAGRQSGDQEAPMGMLTD